jgi:hypothetical protein
MRKVKDAKSQATDNEIVSLSEKKQGQRKAKKVRRMREAIELRRSRAQPKPSSDQHDVVPCKPGSVRDRNRDPRPDVGP